MKKTLLIGCSLLIAAAANAQNCSDIFISEYVEGTFNDKAIELYNPTSQPINLGIGQYKMGRARDGADLPMFIDITGVIAPYDVMVFVLDKRDPNGTGNEAPVSLDLQAKADTFINPIYVQNNSPMYFNGDDAFVLIKGTSNILDIIGKLGEDPGNGWWVPGDPDTKWWTTDNTLIRKNTVQHGVTINPAVFDPSLEWDSLPGNTFDNLGTHNCLCGSVGVKEKEDASFSMFPNPLSSGELSITSNNEISAYSIFSSGGKLIKREERLGNQKYYSLSLPEAVPGMYFIEITFSDGRKSYQKLLAK